MEYESVKADYDAPWKEALTLYFEQFLSFFFPEIHSKIDWSQPYQSLDKELLELGRDSDTGTQFPDKLFEVQLITGNPLWILIHVEVQSQSVSDFPKRIYRYNYRAFDQYDKPVVSLAILGDDTATWRPTEYAYTLDGYELKLKFPTAKLLDYQTQWEELESEQNPFALMVMAHLKTQATNRKMEERKQWKWTLIRSLFDRGYSREEVENLFRFIDRMMSLPKQLEQQLRTQLIEYREERQMPFISPMEELIREEAMEQGLEQGTLRNQRENILELLQVRFGEVPQSVVEAINRLEEIPTLKQLHRQTISVGSIAEFEQLLNPQTDS
ncbi:transposase [Laspinema olomoucense]|uniref:Transposase n=1 Tax=Laspinema olomoucense D3b TaxID=2953688 RepID=A0ABT2N9I5_9CYAN|nr:MULTISPECIES: transposase [unclassified Laspinema]MCT7975436.1 transposase [Laspinema sp. D3d]MCT7979363.1 transposase [Laspinema sp. D3b]MCT7993364.1 transposase [Laspinema sp. D3c]